MKRPLPAKAEPAEAEPATPAPEAAPASEETPPAAEPTPPEAAPAAEPEPAPELEPEDPNAVTPIASKRPRVELPAEDEVGRLALAFQKRNRDLTLEEAFVKAKAQLSGKATTTVAPELPETIEEVDAAINAAREERRKASAEYRTEASTALTEKVEDLQQHRFDLVRKAERQALDQATAFERGWAASEQRAVELYPAAADPNSQLSKVALEIEKALVENEDPLNASPQKPLRVFQMAAARLNIAPRSKTAAPVKATVPAATQPVVKKNVIPSGQSTTVKPSVGQLSPIESKVRQINGDPKALREVYKQLGMRV